MSLALVGTQKYPQSEDPRRPAIEANGTLLLGDEDGKSPTQISLTEVAPFHQGGGSSLREFNSLAGDGVGRLTWTISLTDSRVLFSAPEVLGPYGGVKTKRGRMTAGQLKYEWLAELVWAIDVLWLLTPMTKAHNQERVGLGLGDDSLVSELARRPVIYWQGRGRTTERLESGLREFVAAQGEPGRAFSIDLALKNDGEAYGPVSVVP